MHIGGILCRPRIESASRDSDGVQNMLFVVGHRGRNNGKDPGLEGYVDSGPGLVTAGTTKRTWILSGGGCDDTETAWYIRSCSLQILESFVSELNWKGGELRDWSVRRQTDACIEFRVRIWTQNPSCVVKDCSELRVEPDVIWSALRMVADAERVG